MVVEARFTPGGALPELPHFGMQIAVPAAQGTMTWLGRGPHENYWDRHSGAPVGRYSGRVDQPIHDYVRPQENGNRTDVCWIALTDADGAGLRDTITLNLDYRQTGVGGDDGCGARPHAGYTLDPRPYAYRFRLRAYAPAMGPLDDLARRPLPKP